MIPNQITIHHSASGFNTTIEQIDQWHKVRGFTKSSLGFYVGYHYVIFSDGTIHQTRRDNEIGCHSIPNDGKIGICLIGNFQITEPKSDQLESLISIINVLKKTYNISNILGHRDCNLTECPGDNLYKYTTKLSTINLLQRLIKHFLNPKFYV